jgi:hypothetical protein
MPITAREFLIQRALTFKSPTECGAAIIGKIHPIGGVEV